MPPAAWNCGYGLSGYATHQLYLGRLGALWVIGVALSVPYFVLIR